MIPLLPQIHPPMYQERSPMRNETKRSVSTKLSAAYEFGTNFEREKNHNNDKTTHQNDVAHKTYRATFTRIRLHVYVYTVKAY